MSDPFFAVAGEKVDNGNFYHRVASRLLLHGSTCHAYQYLCGQCGVIDTHIKFEQLVLCFAGYTFASQIYTMTHVQQGVYTRNEFHVCFIVHEVRICFDGSGYFFKFISCGGGFPCRSEWSWKGQLSLRQWLLRLLCVPCSYRDRSWCR